METKEVHNMDRYEYCYQLIEDIGETADEIEKVFRLPARKPWNPPSNSYAGTLEGMKRR